MNGIGSEKLTIDMSDWAIKDHFIVIKFCVSFDSRISGGGVT